MDNKNQVIIVGGGLVGSLWAVLLQRKGFFVTLFEKRPDIRAKSAVEERSINLVITSRGLYGLEKAGLLEEALALSVPVYGRMIHTKSEELNYQAYGQEKECNLSISRTALNQFLLTAAERAGAKIFFEHEIETIDFEKTATFIHPVQAFRAHGEAPPPQVEGVSPQATQNKVEISYNILFGTDGAGSLVRKNLIRHSPSEFRENIEWLEADYLELFLPAGKNNQPRIEKNALHIWPRGSHMMMALANLDGSFTVTLYLPKTGGAINFVSIQTAAQVQSLFESEFPDAISLMPQYIEDFINHPQGQLGTVRCSKWIYKDSVALMGDAAHAVVPFFGQGMNCGFEDCTQLLRLLEENQNDWSSALPQYDKIQRPNANAIADMAIENWFEMRDKVGDQKFLLRKKVESVLEKQFPKIFKSRYGMVTYTLIPYALTQEAGRIQDRILMKLCEGLPSVEGLSLENAEKLLASDFVPFLKANKIDLKSYNAPITFAR